MKRIVLKMMRATMKTTLLNDLYLNPQRYVRVSVFGGKEKRKLSEKELERLQRLIDAELDEREAGGN